MKPDVAARFWAKVDRTDDCWVWTAAVGSHGYGAFNLGHGLKQVLAHRFAYEQLMGPIPDGLQIDHLCRNRRCVRPDHLEAVTQKENIARQPRRGGVFADADHCLRGHEFTDENTRLYAGRRWCRACSRERKSRVRA